MELAFDKGALSKSDVFSGIPGLPRSRGSSVENSRGTAGRNPGQLVGLVEVGPIRKGVILQKSPHFRAVPPRQTVAHVIRGGLISLSTSFQWSDFRGTSGEAEGLKDHPVIRPTANALVDAVMQNSDTLLIEKYP